jgi:cellulose synthase/poly-beta-1,6-N-acetylglucosamine synthase-like glycosyltransferase
MLEFTGQVIFWSCMVLLLHTYILYPLALAAARFAKGPGPAGKVHRPGDEPAVSVLLSVYNEEGHVGGRIGNILAANYPADRIEVLVGSDGSSDGTNGVLAGFTDPRVRVFTFPERRGKAAVLNDLVLAAAGPVIVFTDANTRYDADTIPGLVGPLAEPSIGGVCGELRLGPDGPRRGSDGEVSYWSYENSLKRLESDMGTILGATGAVYAIRKELYAPLPTDKLVVDDFLVPLAILRRGYSVRYNPRAIAFESSAGSVAGEFRRKVRIGTANFFALREFSDLLHPRRGFVAFALWSHKLIRWFAPVLLILLFGATVASAGASPFYGWVFALEAAFLGLAGAGFVGERLRLKLPGLVLPYYFIAMNAALLVGLVRFLSGVRRPHWDVVR